MEKTVQIVTIHLDKKGWDKNDLLKTKNINNPIFATASQDCGTFISDEIIKDNFIAQQLLVLSDDEIQEGDWYFSPFFGRSFQKSLGGGMFNKKYKKIIASYPHIEGTFSISKETVQEWLNASSPKEGKVDMGQFYKGSYYGKCKSCAQKYISDKRWLYCKECSEKQMKVDIQGNLLLEFNNNIDLKEIAEKRKDRVLFPESLARANTIISQIKIPSMPTDEEIDIKGRAFYFQRTKRTMSENSRPDMVIGYREGYKQALEDLKH